MTRSNWKSITWWIVYERPLFTCVHLEEFRIHSNWRLITFWVVRERPFFASVLKEFLIRSNHKSISLWIVRERPFFVSFKIRSWSWIIRSNRNLSVYESFANDHSVFNFKFVSEWFVRIGNQLVVLLDESFGNDLFFCNLRRISDSFESQID